MIKNKGNIFKRRIINNTKYSIYGIQSAFRNEEAFRIESFLAIVLIPLGLYLGQTYVEKILLLISVMFVLVVELLNSAIENVVDRFGEEKHELSKNAKDQGSAAVSISLLIVILTWSLILIPSYII